jgi:hypothetical protein
MTQRETYSERRACNLERQNRFQELAEHPSEGRQRGTHALHHHIPSPSPCHWGSPGGSDFARNAVISGFGGVNAFLWPILPTLMQQALSLALHALVGGVYGLALGDADKSHEQTEASLCIQ